MKGFFRNQASLGRLQTDASTTNNFGSLYKFVKGLFSTGYGVLMVASIFIAIMAFMVYAVMLMTAQNGRERDEAKRKIMTGCIVVVIIFFSLAIVTTIAFTFFGMSNSERYSIGY